MSRNLFAVALLLLATVCLASPAPSKAHKVLFSSFVSREEGDEHDEHEGELGTLDTCDNDKECHGPMICAEKTCFSSESTPCTSNATCADGDTCGVTIFNITVNVCSNFTLDSLKCEGTSDCEDHVDICAEGNSTNYCISEKLAEKKGLEEVCIAIHHLDEHGLAAKDRVFKTNYMAWVWCDAKESCATAGHMVVWNGQSMMMKSYCDLVGGCTKKLMKVNSPKYGRKIRIGSRSEGLEFTAFAAKWATSTEERALSGLIRLGM